MSSEARYEVNKPEVVDESVDGEALIVHLGTGAYYSARGTADAAWTWFAAGASATEVAEALADGAGVDAAGQAVRAFLDDILAEGLMRPRSTPPAAMPVHAPGPFSAPLLEKFTDMQDLLLLDPIHDVDDAQGWPNARPAVPGSQG